VIEPMVRLLLEQQYADLAHLPLALIDAGFDDELWRRETISSSACREGRSRRS
jgi:hypothetical protein